MKKVIYITLISILGLWSCEEKSVVINATVETGEVSNIGINEATIDGEISATADIDILGRGIVYNTSGNPVFADDIAVTAGVGLGPFEVILENLDADTEYFARAYATTSEGTTYGKSVIFTTLQQPFSIVSHDPLDNATNVAVDKKIKIVFSDDIDISSISNSSFTITKDNGLSAGQGTVDINGGEIVITHSSAYLSDHEYTVWLSTALKSTSGVNLASDYNFSFKTEDNIAPTILDVSVSAGATNVGVTNSFLITFSEPISNTSAQKITLTHVNSGDLVAATITVSDNQVTLDPSESLKGSQLYRLKIPTTVQDLSGNNLENTKEVPFTTESQYFTMNSMSPEHNSTDFDTKDGKIIFNFSADIDPNTVDVNSIWIEGAYSAGLGLLFDVDGSKITITPLDIKEGAKRYKIHIDGSALKDINGNRMDPDYSHELTISTEVVRTDYWYKLEVYTVNGGGQILDSYGDNSVALNTWGGYTGQVWRFTKHNNNYLVTSGTGGLDLPLTTGNPDAGASFDKKAFLYQMNANGNPNPDQVMKISTNCETCPQNVVQLHNSWAGTGYSLSNTSSLKMIATGPACCRADHTWVLVPHSKIQ